MMHVMTAKVVIDLAALKELRDQNGYSISDLAAKLGYKTPTGYWLIEQGQRKVSIDTLYRLAEIYDCSMEDLITENPEAGE
jgi:transcriptional regulator with XRE-family HTH domain